MCRQTRRFLFGTPVLSLSVQSSGGPAQPVSIETRAVNGSGLEAWHCQGCGCGNGTSVTVLGPGPEGTPVLLTDPREAVALCPDTMVPWSADGVVENKAQFTGTLYRTDASFFSPATYEAPAGTYTVVAEFSYASVQDGPFNKIEQRATFEWQP